MNDNEAFAARVHAMIVEAARLRRQHTGAHANSGHLSAEKLRDAIREMKWKFPDVNRERSKKFLRYLNDNERATHVNTQLVRSRMIIYDEIQHLTDSGKEGALPDASVAQKEEMSSEGKK